ncbi:MAG: MBL fold metallo-hydrolase [Candidatus Delongbacteria bacterium]|nr:MBL fold metallo-hydrolase [Candidatus Delongbacteria bacterium]MCG2759721.1 MBL fold metallo-hydrolase [Candidatus Delongbacteria bacterium]
MNKFKLFVLTFLLFFVSCEDRIFLEKTPDIICRDGKYILDPAGYGYDKVILSKDGKNIELTSCRENQAGLIIFNNGEKGYYDFYLVNDNDTVVAKQTYIGKCDLKVFKVTVLDVSQGDSFIIEPPYEKPSVMDGGYGSSGEYFWQDGGSKTLVNHLIEENIFDIKYIIETHHDIDHYGGLYDIKDDESFNYESYLTYESDLPDYGDTLFFSNEVKGVLLHYGEIIEKAETCENDKSIAIKLIYKDFEMIFTGDIEETAEGMILSRGLLNAEEDYEVLKVAHHGSSSSSSAEFLNAVMPLYSIISVGTGNDYGHPATEVLDRLKVIESDILRTDLNSTIEIFTDGYSFQMVYRK